MLKRFLLINNREVGKKLCDVLVRQRRLFFGCRELVHILCLHIAGFHKRPDLREDGFCKIAFACIPANILAALYFLFKIFNASSQIASAKRLASPESCWLFVI
ncbi:MAG: hypothetical protein ACLT0Y_07470 [Christensenellales bacterium]